VREEGARIKHGIDGNPVKACGKGYTAVESEFQAETALQPTDGFRVYRRQEVDRTGKKAWRVLRRGVADFPRPTAVSAWAVDCYLDALAWVDDETTVQDLLVRLGQASRVEGPAGAGAGSAGS
jgi:hypothetical protein